MKPLPKVDKIVIINQIALNLGDAAILWGNIEIIKRKYGPSTEIVVFDSAAEIAQKYRPWVKFRHSLFFRPVKGVFGRLLQRTRFSHLNNTLKFYRFLMATKLLKINAPFLAKWIVSENEVKDLLYYATADLIVSAGGTYLIENYDLSARIMEFRFALAIGKPLILFTQTLGPFNTISNRLAFKEIFSAAEVVLLRDEKSKNHILDLDVSAQNIHLAADAAFVFADRKFSADRQLVKPLKMAVSVRSMDFFNSQENQVNAIGYYEGIVLAIQTAVEEFGAEVTFLSTCQGIPEYWTNDADTAERIYDMLPREIKQHVELDSEFLQPWELVDKYAQYDAVIATRMHAAILSLCAGTPTLGIAYEFKTEELFDAIDMTDLVISVDSFSEGSVKGKVNNLLSGLVEHRSNVKLAADKMLKEAWKAERVLPDIQ